jgi:hypothetical protein
MNRQQQINLFSLAAHRLAVARLREEPQRLLEVRGVLERWRAQAGEPTHCDPYWNEWDRLLSEGVDAIERAVCVPTDQAATLRSMSPLGRLISVGERNELLRQARVAA